MADRPPGGFPPFLLSSLMFLACVAAESNPGAKSHVIGFGGFRFLSVEALRVDNRSLPISPATTTDGACFSIDGFQACISPGPGSFQLAVTNGTDGDIRVGLPDSKYLDEKRREHAVYGYPGQRGRLSESLRSPDTITIPQGERTIFRIAPVEKAYYVQESEEEHNLIHEVLLPWEVRDRSVEEVRRSQDELIANRTPVTLVLSVTTQGVRRSIEFDFVLEEP